MKKEWIYIAGPECFYTGGTEMLAAMRKRAESQGFGVTLPNDHPLDMSSSDLRKHADSIFEDLKVDMLDTTVIIADLEAYRGSEPDSGTVYELGMAYAKGAKCYGYTRDKRPLAWKDQKYVLRDKIVYDEHGKEAPYKELPFAPCIIGSTKIVEGDFDDCLQMLRQDLEEEEKAKGMRGYKEAVKEAPAKEKDHGEMPVVYLAGPERYEKDAAEIYDRMKKLCADLGLKAIAPIDWAEGIEPLETDSFYAAAANLFDNYQQHVRDCDAVIANLNDYRGYECSNDVGFECGMGFQLGKKLYGYMDDAGFMKDRVPHLGEEEGFRDMTGANVENFDYPLNLMFSCSMDIHEGKFEDMIRKVAEDLKK